MTTPALVASLAGDLGIFLAAAGLLALVLLRPSLVQSSPVARSALAAGATLLAAGSILHGSGVESSAHLHGIAALRLVAIGLLCAGALALRESRNRQALLGALLIYAAGEAAVVSGAVAPGDAVRAIGAVCIFLAIYRAARTSLAARIGAAAGILLVVLVLVLSGSLSVVLTNNVEHNALESAGDRARAEAGFLETEGARAGDQAKTLARLIARVPSLLRSFEAADEPTRADQIKNLNENFANVDFIEILNPQRGVVAATDTLTNSERVALAGSDLAVTAIDTSSVASALVNVPAALLATGAAPIVVRDPRGVPVVEGAIVAGYRINDDRLRGRKALDPSVNLTLDVSGVVAATTWNPKPLQARDLLDGGKAAGLVGTAEREDVETSAQGHYRNKRYFLAAAPVHDRVGSIGKPTGALLIVSQSAKPAAETRDDVKTTLFLVALGAGLVSLALALLLGERIGRPLGRLTRAAEAIRRGDLGVRSDVRSADEVGTLGTAFDEMAGSVQRMTTELADAAAQREAILASMTDGLLATDERGRVTMVNPAAETLLDVRGEKVSGHLIADVVRGRDRTGTDLGDRLRAPIGEPWSAAGFLADGDLPVALSSAPIRDDDGRLAGAVYLVRDMRREFEIERMKTEFLSNISHELRTPLTPIKGYAEMLRLRRVPAGRARIFLDGILDASERLERIIDILVNFAALEAGRFVLRTEALDVREVLHQMSERWRSRSPNHEVEEKVSTRIPRVVADRRLLERSIDELIDNAVKYSPDGGRVTLRAKVAANGDGRVLRISVADEGLGIEPEDVGRIFDEFQQLDGSATRRFGGLGLGLPFVQRVVAAHHGHVDVDSEPGRGSVFTLNLPVDGPTRSR